MEPGWATPRSSVGKTSLDIFEGVSVPLSLIRGWLPRAVDAGESKRTPPEVIAYTQTPAGIGPVVGYPLSLAAHLDTSAHGRRIDFVLVIARPPNTPANTHLIAVVQIRSTTFNHRRSSLSAWRSIEQ